jgi:hypothetical protein
MVDRCGGDGVMAPDIATVPRRFSIHAHAASMVTNCASTLFGPRHTSSAARFDRERRRQAVARRDRTNLGTDQLSTLAVARSSSSRIKGVELRRPR